MLCAHKVYRYDCLSHVVALFRLAIIIANNIQSHVIGIYYTDNSDILFSNTYTYITSAIIIITEITNAAPVIVAVVIRGR